jgi:hypothetical protein
MGVKRDSGSVDVSIDRLLLEGFDADVSEQIGKALESELQSLISAGGRPPAAASSVSIHFIDAASFEAAPGVRVEAVGVHLARAILGGRK